MSNNEKERIPYPPPREFFLYFFGQLEDTLKGYSYMLAMHHSRDDDYVLWPRNFTQAQKVCFLIYLVDKLNKKETIFSDSVVEHIEGTPEFKDKIKERFDYFIEKMDDYLGYRMALIGINQETGHEIILTDGMKQNEFLAFIHAKLNEENHIRPVFAPWVQQC